MVDWKYLLYAQYPAFFLLALFFLISYVRVRKASAVKSILWVLLFGFALAASILFTFLGIPAYWTFKTVFRLKAASWIGVILAAVAAVAHIVHLAEKKHAQKVMEKELRKAERNKAAAVAQAQEEGREAARQALEAGRRAAHQEAAAERFSQAADAVAAEAATSELAQQAQAPIALTLNTSAEESPLSDIPESPENT